jgi:hypothetical protein
MATWIEINLDLAKLDKGQIAKTENGTYYRALVKVVDDYQYGKNAYVITSYPKDSKPEKEHKIGNGRVVFTDGTIEKAVRDDQPAQAAPVQNTVDADFPF